MSLWDKTPTTLTSFTPLSSEVQASGNFITRWLRKGKDESDQSSDGGGSQGHSRETSVDRDQSREQSLERRLSQQSCSRASLIDGSHGEQVSESESSQSESTKKLGEPSLERSESTEASKRTLRSVITRLSAILERRTATPQVYRDSDFKQYWMPDSSCRECYDCGDKFTTFRRRHHCRICGQIFCNACCNQELPGKIIGYKGSIRVCDYCCQVAQRFAQKADPASDPKVTKEVLRKAYKETDPEGGLKGQRRSTLELMGQLRLRSPGDLETSGSLDSVAPFDLTPQAEFVSMDMTERRMLTQDSAELRQLWNWMLDPVRGVEFQNYRIRLRTYQRCIAGNKLVDWLLRQDKVKNRIQAIAIGQALIDADLLDPILNVTTPFRDDFTLYRPAEISLIEPMTPQQEVADETIPEDSAPLWFQEIQTSTEETVTLVEEHYMKSQEIVAQKDEEQKSVDESKQLLTGVADHFDEPLPHQNTVSTDDLADPLFSEGVSTAEKSIEESTGSAAWRTLNIFSDDNMEKSVFDSLQHEHHDHLTALTKQLLSEENLPTGWADIIISTVDRVSLFVKPDIKNSSDDMDIRQYVHLKKIPGGRREQTGYVHGVIFKKNVAHKKMSQHLSNPRTLLMNGSIEYQRVENKMSSLQPQILQEEEFLRKGIAKIAALKPKPDILIVEKSVSRLAQDFLLQNGITLIYNVKMSVMERLSRFLQADIVPSIDSLVTMPALGFCHTFSVASYTLPSGENKTMLCFDGCATHLGCSITLRGGSLSELKKVKKVMHFMIYASYHSRLEISFCMDEYLMPPPRMEEIDFDLESIKYNRKHQEASNQQGIVVWGKEQGVVTGGNQEGVVASKNVKNKISVQHTDTGSGDNEIRDSDKGKGIEDGKEVKDTGLSQSTETVSRIELMEKDMLALERDLHTKGCDDLKIADIDSKTANYGAMNTNAVENKVYTFRDKPDSTVDNEPRLARFVTLRDSGDRTASKIDIDSAGEDVNVGIKDLEMVNTVKLEDEGTLSGTTTELSMQSKVDQNDQNINTSVNVTHSTGNGAKEIKDHLSEVIVDARDHKSEVVRNMNDKDIRKLSTIDTLNKGDSIEQSHVDKLINKIDNVPKLEIHLKETCDSSDRTQSADLLKLRSVSSPNFEKTFPFASDELNHRTADIKAIDNLKKPDIDRTKTVLKSCMSEAVIKCDKTNHSKSDKSPSLRRKVESTCLTDQSDPLQSYQKSHDDSIFQSSLEMEEQKNRFKLKKALENIILAVSPYIHYDLPYLETEQGFRCELRRYFPEEIYWSHHFSPKTASSKRNKSKYIESEPGRKTDRNVTISKAHELIRCKLNMPATDPSIQTLIAKFRAYGGRINVLGPQNGNSLLFPPFTGQKGDQSKGKENQSAKVSSAGKTNKDSDVKEVGMLWERKGKGKEKQTAKVPSAGKTNRDSDVKDVGMLWERKIDCLEPARHQRIAVLFSSFSYASENHPSPCVYPWVVTMEFYGRNDITLGGFLERFCFRPSYECPSDTCSTAMVDHIRRFAHGTGSISVVLKRLNHHIQNGQENILIWSWCHKCKQVTPVTAMSTDTWNMSFAKYLEIRFHGSVFQRRASAEPCGHSLHHDHFQYFGFRDTVASFKYAPIKIKEIKLPPFIICCVKMVETIHLYRMSEFNKTLLKQATEMYSRMLDGMTKLKAESSCEILAKTISNYILQQQTEKTHMRELAQGIREKLHVLLKQEPDKKILKLNTDQYKLYTDAEDGMVVLKKMMAEAVANWNNKIQELYIQQTKRAKQSGQKKEKDKELGSQDKEIGTPNSLIETREKDTGTPSSFTQAEEDVQSAKTAEGDLSPTSFSEKDDMSSIVGSDLSSRRTSECPSVHNYIRKITSTTSLDSYTYGVTPGISAVWPSSPRSPDSFVVCHRDQVPPIDFERSAEDLEGVVIPSLTPQLEPVTIATTDSGTIGTTDPGTIATTDPVTIKTCVEPVTIATTEPVTLTNAETVATATSEPVGIPQTTTTNEETKGPEGLKIKTDAPEGDKEKTEVKDRTETPRGDQKLAVQEPIPVRRSPQEDQIDSSTTDKLSAIKKTLISSIWQAPVAFQQQMPFDACDHHLLPPCAVVPVVVYDHEPSSIIAYSLSCHDYHSKLQEIQTSFSPQRDVTQGTNSSSKTMKSDQEPDTEKSSKHDETANLARRPSSGKLSFFRGSSREPVPVSRPEVIDTVRYIPKPDALLKESPCAIIDVGVGETQMNDILADLNIPSPHHKTVKEREREVGPSFENVAEESCDKAVDKEQSSIRKLNANRPTKDHVVQEVSTDGAWQRRGTGQSKNSLSGHVTVVGKYSKKCLAFAVAKKTCRICKSSEKKKRPPPKHNCRRNWSGSSKAMEPFLTIQSLRKLKKKGFVVKRITMDDDCTTFVRAKRSISDDLQKSSDKNHVIKNFSNQLYKLREKNKGLTVKCIQYFTKCFSYALSQNKGNPSGMKKDVGAITPHAFGDHQHCDQRWCKYLEDPSTYRHKSLPFGKDLTDASLRTELYTVFEKYTTEAMCNKMSEMQSSNSNENLNQLIARKAPKALHYSGSESLDFRVSAAMAQKNDGHSYYPEVNKRHQLSPGKFTVKRKQMQDRKRESRAKTQNSTAMKKRRLQLKAERNYIDQRQEVLEGPSYEPAIVSLEEIDEDAVKEIPPPVQSAPCPEVQANEDDAHVVFDLETTGFDDDDYALYSSRTNDNGDKSKESAHIEIQFSDSIARFYCKVYFAEQFRQLRKQVLPDGEDVFIRSLSRCRTWEAKGGKSGSSFRKTIDDRFILKQMSSMEVESFEKFGPQYFQYIYKSEKQQRPSALAKIVGVYRIGFRNQQTNNAMKQDLLVVENLFYNRNISQTYDLKGSERNRLVKTKSGKRGEEIVLLDENFLRASVDCPLYILPHSKTMLTVAISHDSQFLSSNLVMDYSLLVGVDEEKKELVVGIIDYIRTFTWDKKLETILKSNFGGQGKMPTVVSPEVYRTRFLDMMGKYFLAVPDQWSGLGRDVDN